MYVYMSENMFLSKMNMSRSALSFVEIIILFSVFRTYYVIVFNLAILCYVRDFHLS